MIDWPVFFFPHGDGEGDVDGRKNTDVDGKGNILMEVMAMDSVPYAVHAMRMMHVSGLFHGPTHLVSTAVHVFEGANKFNNGTYCIASTT